MDNDEVILSAGANIAAATPCTHHSLVCTPCHFDLNAHKSSNQCPGSRADQSETSPCICDRVWIASRSCRLYAKALASRADACLIVNARWHPSTSSKLNTASNCSQAVYRDHETLHHWLQLTVFVHRKVLQAGGDFASACARCAAGRRCAAHSTHRRCPPWRCTMTSGHM